MIAAKCKKCGTIGCNGNNIFCSYREEIINYDPNLFKDMKETLITAQEDYIKFLEEECGKVSSQIAIYGWKCPEKTVNKGIELRDEINRLKNLLK